MVLGSGLSISPFPFHLHCHTEVATTIIHISCRKKLRTRMILLGSARAGWMTRVDPAQGGYSACACGCGGHGLWGDFGSLNVAVYRSFLFASRLVTGRFWMAGLTAKWLPDK